MSATKALAKKKTNVVTLRSMIESGDHPEIESVYEETNDTDDPVLHLLLSFGNAWYGMEGVVNAALSTECVPGDVCLDWVRMRLGINGLSMNPLVLQMAETWPEFETIELLGCIRRASVWVLCDAFRGVLRPRGVTVSDAAKALDDVEAMDVSGLDVAQRLLLSVRDRLPDGYTASRWRSEIERVQTLFRSELQEARAQDRPAKAFARKMRQEIHPKIDETSRKVLISLADHGPLNKCEIAKTTDGCSLRTVDMKMPELRGYGLVWRDEGSQKNPWAITDVGAVYVETMMNSKSDQF